jgi:hypothetical protein
MTEGIREGVSMEKDGDSEEDNDEEVVKQVVKRIFFNRNIYFIFRIIEDGEKKYFNPSDLLQSRIENTTKMKINNLIWSM